MSFVGDNEADADAKFQYRHLNEVYDDERVYGSLEGLTFGEIEKLSQDSQNVLARQFMTTFLAYPLTVVMLSESQQSEEFNLQFTRLNLGTIINSGEKLNAMVGDLRNECFDGIGKHSFLKGTNIPTRRFAESRSPLRFWRRSFPYMLQVGMSGPGTSTYRDCSSETVL